MSKADKALAMTQGNLGSTSSMTLLNSLPVS